MPTTDLTRRAEALQWFEREVEFYLNDRPGPDDEIGTELRNRLGAALDLPNLFGASVLAIQGAAAYIAGRRAA